MTRAKVDDWIEKAKKQPKFVERFKRIEIEDAAATLELENEFLDDLKEQYEPELVKEYTRWGKICDSLEPYVLICKRGKKVIVDIVEFHVGIDDVEHYKDVVDGFTTFAKKFEGK